MSLNRKLQVVRRRRAALKARFDVARTFEALEETCVPSYLHPNPLAAAVSWWRLMAAADLYAAHAPEGPVLDFGASSGELFHMIEPKGPLAFVEELAPLRAALTADLPEAKEHTLDDLPESRFKAIFALDSLEHNEDIAGLVDRLIAGLAPDGVMIVSGPTENWLYRLGRRVAGYSGHYHHQTIHDIEAVIAGRLTRRAVKVVPFGLPLFRLSVWSRP